jgi:3-hydroxyacyl-[acyl-carrier-protein] dehydratase
MAGFFNLSNIEYQDKRDGFVSYYKFNSEDPVFLGHYPNFPILPASLLIDICCKQISSYLLVDDITQLSLAIDKANFYKGIMPGDYIHFDYSFDGCVKHGIDRINVAIKHYEKLVTVIYFKNHTVLDASNMDSKNINYDDSTLKNKPAIYYLPQRFPLLVVDRILDNGDPLCSIAKKYVTYSDYCYRDTCLVDLSDKDLAYPHGGVIEGIEQSAGFLLAMHWRLNDDGIVIVIGGVSGVRFYRNAYPGDVIKFHSILNYMSDTYAILSGAAMVCNDMLLTIEKIFVVKQEIKSLS